MAVAWRTRCAREQTRIRATALDAHPSRKPRPVLVAHSHHEPLKLIVEMQGIRSTVSRSGERKYWPGLLSNDRLRTSIPRGRACHRRDDGGLSPAEARSRQMKVQFGRSSGAARLISSLRASTARAIQFRAPDQAVDTARRHGRGQSLLEFALVIPVLMVLLGGAVQYGVVFAAKNSLTQVVRDTARWASTQTLPQCTDAATGTPPPLLDQADQIGQTSSLIGYSAGMWNAGNFKVYPYVTPLPAGPPFGVLPATPPNSEGVEVAWSYDSGGACPPADNVRPAYVTIRITHSVPILLPGLQYLPGLGSCGPSGCFIRLWSTSEFRMEPARQ
jgi:hypothetical protein